MSADVNSKSHWLALVKADAIKLDKVPSEFLGFDLYMAAVTVRGAQLKAVMKHLGDDANNEKIKPELIRLCRAAVEQYPLAIVDVPKALLDDAICDLALRGGTGWVLYHIPEPMRTLKRCSTALKADPSAIGYIPAAILTLKMAREAQSKDQRVLTLIPHAPQIQNILVDDALIAIFQTLQNDDSQINIVAALKSLESLVGTDLVKKPMLKTITLATKAIKEGNPSKAEKFLSDAITITTASREKSISDLHAQSILKKPIRDAVVHKSVSSKQRVNSPEPT